MNLTKFAIENNRVALSVLTIIIVLGLTGYNNLSRDSMPPFTIRVCSIVTNFPGASPERVESLITDKVEQVAQELPELKEVTSESRTGLSVVNVSLRDEIRQEDLQAVWDRLRRKVNEIKEDLPEGIRGPNVKDDGIGVVYGVQLAMVGDGFSFADMKQYAENIKDDLIKLDDASEVEISGIQEEQIYVAFDNSTLAKVGLTASMLQSVIASTNIVFPGGQVSLEDERIVLEPTGNFESIDDLANMIITVPKTGGTIKLGEITSISRDFKTPTNRLVRYNRQPSLVIATALKEGANLIQLGEQVDARLETYNAGLPLGLELHRISSSDRYVDTKIQDFVSNVIQSVAIVLAVMLLFLGFRTGMVVASLIPAALIMTLWLMDLFAIGLNQVSLAALIMALGMLVDNAIVVSEAMMVKMEEGMPAKEAAISACSELMIPLLVSSLTTSAAFLAFFLAESTMGEMMGPLFVVITMALLSSWLMAMTVIPMLAINMIKVKSKSEQTKPGLFDRLGIYYKRLLAWVLRRSWLFFGIILGAFVLSLMFFGRIPFIFFPDSDRNLITLDLNLPLGTKVERTTAVIEKIENYIAEELQVNENRTNGIIDYTTFISEGPKSYDLGYQPGEANSGYAHMLINTSSFEDNQSMVDALDAFAFDHLPDAEVSVAPLAGGGGGGSDVEIRLSGDDPRELFRISETIKQKLNSLPTTKNIKDDWGPLIKKFIIDIDQDKANRAGITNQDIALSLSTSLEGYDAGAFRDGEDNIPIIMRNQRSQEMRASELETLPIFAQGSGQNVPLAQVANIRNDWQYAKIKRRNLYRTMVVSCDARTGITASEITNIITPWLAEASQDWKPGFTYSLGGESEQSAEAMGAVAAKLPLAGFIILLLLISQFNSFRKTSIVLSTIPLGIIGVIVGLLLFPVLFWFYGVPWCYISGRYCHQ